MFISVYTPDVGLSAIHVAMELGNEFSSRGKTVAILDASLTMSQSLADSDVLRCSSDAKQTCLPIFTRVLRTDEFESSTYVAAIFKFPLFKAVDPHEIPETTDLLALSRMEDVCSFALNIEMLQGKFDIIISVNYFSVDDLNGLLCMSSDLIVFYVESQMGASEALRRLSWCTKKVVLVKANRIPTTFKWDGLAGSYDFWVNKGSPLTAFLMKKAKRFTSVGGSERIMEYRQATLGIV